MSFINRIFTRTISTSSTRYGKRNFRKFPIYNKRGTRAFKVRQAEEAHPDVPIYSEFS